jgi:transposase
MAKSYRP